MAEVEELVKTTLGVIVIWAEGRRAVPVTGDERQLEEYPVVAAVLDRAESEGLGPTADAA